MTRRAGAAEFVRSLEASGFLLVVLFAGVLSVYVAYVFYRTSLGSFTETKRQESVTTLHLVDAFVNEYAAIRSQFKVDAAPVPATFRAQAIARFAETVHDGNALRLRAVGPPGRFIVTPPGDAATAAAITAFADSPNPQPDSAFLGSGNDRIFRTIYPSVAKDQSCVDCHNRLRPSQHWKLGDVMGAFVADVPMAHFVDMLRLRCVGIAVLLFTMIGGVGLWITVIHHRRLADREAARTRIEQSEIRFRDFAEASSDWFWEQDAQLLISFVSENAVSKRLGSTPAKQLGRTRREIVDGVSAEQWAQHDADQAARRPFQKFRFQRTDATGELRHVELSGKPIFDAAGDFAGYRGTAKDVTAEIATELELTRRVEERTAELRALQDELLRKERLSTLGQFTATVAHELRNPLSAIRNTAFAIAEATTARGLRLDRSMGRLDRSIARCDRLISDLLEYTRMRELICVELPLNSWLEEVLDEQKFADDIVLRRDLGPVDRPVRLDPDCFRRVIINLLENAAQALVEMPPAGLRQITVTTRSDGATARIVIADTGPGIPADVLPKIFDPLFSTKSFGTGLGLPTVRQIVEQHGATIAVATEPGSGTCITVTVKLVAYEEPGGATRLPVEEFAI